MNIRRLNSRETSVEATDMDDDIISHLPRDILDRMVDISSSFAQSMEKYVLRYKLFEDGTVNLKGLYLVFCTVPQNSMSVFKCLSNFGMSFSKIVVQDPNILFSGWSKLRTLDFIHCCLPETLYLGSLLNLAGVPHLLELNYSVQESGFSDAFTVLSRDLPKLLQLRFFTFAHWVRCAPVNFRVSCSVTVLGLFFDGDTCFDL
ncbi:hypothetical protein AKJ16_DCAP01480 [Drosera capensis]